MIMENQDNDGKTFIKIPISLFGFYSAIIIQFLGVCFMSGVVWTKLDYQSQSIKELKETMNNTLNDKWRKSDHDTYATSIEAKILDLQNRINNIERFRK